MTGKEIARIPRALVSLRGKFADAKEKASKEVLTPEEIKKRTKAVLLALLSEFLSITDRSDDELWRETKRLKIAFNENEFGHRGDGNLEGELENAYGKAKDEKLKKMILKMLLIVGDGYSGYVAVRLDPKYENQKQEDYEFIRQFFLNLDKNQMKSFIEGAWYPDEELVDAFLQYHDRDFVIDTIINAGTNRDDKRYCRSTLLLLIRKLAPNIDVTAVCGLFEVGVNHNGDHIRNEAAEILRNQYSNFARGYFKQIAEDKELNKNRMRFSLRLAGIRYYALIEKERALFSLRNILLDEQNIDLVDKTLPLLLNKEICGERGAEAIADIISERFSRKEPSPELYWVVWDGQYYENGKFYLVEPYYDLVEMILSRTKNIEKHIDELDEMGINTSRTISFFPMYKANSSRHCLINRLGLERLTEWAVQERSDSLRDNSLTLIDTYSENELTDFIRSNSPHAKVLGQVLGFSLN